LDRNYWKIKEKINVLQQLFCRKEKVVPIGERINVLQQFFAEKRRLCLLGSE
jgi:hypothetical protein